MFSALLRTFRMTLGFCSILGLAVATSAHGMTLWYNGDYNGEGAIPNGINMSTFSPSSVYDDFIVPVPGCIVDTVWSNNFVDFTGVTQAYWEIRTGVSAGDGGAILASDTSSATQVPTGTSAPGSFVEYTIQVTGLDIQLPEGTYWLTVVPIGSGSGHSFISATNGLNAISMAPGDNDAFIDSLFFGLDFEPTTIAAATWGVAPGNLVYYENFSMGIGGSIAPIYLQDDTPEGLISIEAENYDVNSPQGGHNWDEVSDSTYSGNYAMEAVPNLGDNINTNYVFNSPRLDFYVNFLNTGTHYIWARGVGASGIDDSCHVGLDGMAVSTSDRITGFLTHSTWTDATMDGPVATIDIPSTGSHVINVWMREDGLILDKLVISTDPGYVPTDMGIAESPKGTADLNGDGVVDGDDYSVFKTAFGSCEGDANFIPGADLDGDGCITINDLRRLRTLPR